MDQLTPEALSSIGLPKWPQLVVTGETVTREQTYEILIRTSGLYFGCNDQEWEQFCREACGYPNDERDAWYKLTGKPFHDAMDAFFEKEQTVREQLGILSLNYLGNHQIASAFVHGPYGWLGWDGRIGCHAFNIGKWPDTVEVFNEWAMIAKEWPFLTLTSQLFNKEHVEEGGGPVVEYRVREGVVTAHLPDRALTSQISGVATEGLENAMTAILYHRQRERGCSKQVLLDAIKTTKEVMARKPKELTNG